MGGGGGEREMRVVELAEYGRTHDIFSHLFDIENSFHGKLGMAIKCYL